MTRCLEVFRRTHQAREKAMNPVVSIPLNALRPGSVASSGLATTRQADYPSKAVRDPCSSGRRQRNDPQARPFSAKVSENMSQQFVAENRTGAGDSVGFAIAASFSFSPAVYNNPLAP
jgi:hypothetical protein